MALLAETLGDTGFGLLAGLLPSPERERLARAQGVDPPRWSLDLGLVELAIGAWRFVSGGLAFMRPAAASQSMTLLEHWWPGLTTAHFQGLGILNWLAWFLHPGSWPWAYLSVVGLTRCVAFAVTREAVAEPVVCLALRLGQRLARGLDATRRRRRLGPIRPDRVITSRDGGLIVLTRREKRGWQGPVTVEVGDRYYRLVAIEERPDAEWNVLTYVLREEPQGSLIRRLLRYEPPGDLTTLSH
jgi:hypothetical protein